MAVYLVGTPGAAPRLQLLDQGHAAAEAGEGEVCVFVPHLGAWQISADGLSASEIVPTTEALWREVRRTRDSLLTACDWTQLPDVPEATRTAWVSYRQDLRDITTTYYNPGDVVWPTPPDQTA